MADYNIDDPVSLTLSALRTKALQEKRRIRYEESQRRRTEYKLKLEEKERVRRAKEEWEQESRARIQNAKSVNGTTTNMECERDTQSDSSPDLMSPSPRNATAKKVKGRRRSSRGDPMDVLQNEPHTITKTSTGKEGTQRSDSNSDESEVDVKSLHPASQQNQNYQKGPTANSRILSKPSVSFPSKPFLSTKKKYKFESSSSSSEDEAELEERLKRRFEEKKRLGNRHNSGNEDTQLPVTFVRKAKKNRYSSSEESNTPDRFRVHSETNERGVRPRRMQEESSSEDEAELENRFCKSIAEKHLTSWKRNPLSMAKKDETDWKVRLERSMDGSRLHVSSELDLGGSQDRTPRQIQRRLISSPNSIGAYVKEMRVTEDDLWEDWDEDMKKANDSNSDSNVKRRGRKKIDADLTSPHLPKKWTSPFNEDFGDVPIPKEYDSVASTSDEEMCMSNRLKPNFDTPKLGPPGPLVPFKLVKDGTDEKPTNTELKNGIETHEVPASMNRYLKDYQREGIQFMYSSVIEGKGCVLGDDMGLGKTVQVISLIAALQNKTGTDLDQSKIQRLRRDVAKAVKLASRAELENRLGIATSIDTDQIYNNIERPMFAPILIIVPSSVIQNWVNEFESWGHFNIGVYQGANREKAIDDVYNGSNFILIAGKALLTRDVDFSNIMTVQWKLVFVDEYHEYKNHKSQSFRCLQQLRDEMECPIVGMTGTLMQNNHDELFTLIDLVRPTLLEDRQSFMDYTSRPIKLARTKDAKDDIKRIAKQREEELMVTISPAFLERKKEVVLKDTLTHKKEKVIFCELSELQKKLYRHLLSLPDYEMLRMKNAPCGGCNVNQQYFIGYKRLKTRKEKLNYQRRHKDELVPRRKCCFQYPYEVMPNQEPGDKIDRNAILWLQKHKKIVSDPSTIPEGSEIIEILHDGYSLVSCKTCPGCTTLSALSKLHKVCSHPSLLQVDRSAPAGTETDKKLEFAKLAFRPDILAHLPGKDYYRSDGIMDDHLKLSGKMKTLDYCLRRYIRKRDRVLVFSYSTATLDLIQQHVKTQGWTHLRLDGQTPTSSRHLLVDRFQKDESISLFLISTRAGGLGLNLTAANKVIIFDVNWNPSYDEQAQDRSYRIGQQNDVEVIRLVARGTIEEQMYARQVYKVQLKKQTLGGNANGTTQPQIFKGVDKDEKRKGELFGIENLLMYRDGSFMQLLWKKADNPNEAHSVDDIARFTEDDLNQAIEEIEVNYDSDSEDNDDKESLKVKVSKINHEDLFHTERGRARYAQGDAEFEEEMGGQSQMIHVATALACENFDSDSGDENPVESAHHVKSKPALRPVQKEREVETSSANSLPRRDSPSAKQTHRSKVSIMGVIFDDSKSTKAEAKTSSLYIPSYARSKEP